MGQHSLGGLGGRFLVLVGDHKTAETNHVRIWRRGRKRADAWR
jgi:hypothetical protein